MQKLINRLLLAVCLLHEFSSAQTIIRKVYTMCRNTDIDILSTTGVKIERYNTSLVALHFPDSFVQANDTLVMRFSFKTKKRHGLLFYTRSSHDNTEFLSFFLENGVINYQISCPVHTSLEFIETSKQKEFNDGQWHNVTYSVRFMERGKGERANITIDGLELIAKTYRVNCQRVNSVIFGGYRAHDLKHMARPKRVKEHYEGCIRNVFTNLPLRTPPKYSVVSICD